MEEYVITYRKDVALKIMGSDSHPFLSDLESTLAECGAKICSDGNKYSLRVAYDGTKDELAESLDSLGYDLDLVSIDSATPAVQIATDSKSLFNLLKPFINK